MIDYNGMRQALLQQVQADEARAAILERELKITRDRLIANNAQFDLLGKLQEQEQEQRKREEQLVAEREREAQAAAARTAKLAEDERMRQAFIASGATIVDLPSESAPEA